MIIWKDSIPSSCFCTVQLKLGDEATSYNPKKFDIFMLHIFYVLDVIKTREKLGVLFVVVLFVFIVWYKYNTHRYSVAKLTDWSS